MIFMEKNINKSKLAFSSVLLFILSLSIVKASEISE